MQTKYKLITYPSSEGLERNLNLWTSKGWHLMPNSYNHVYAGTCMTIYSCLLCKESIIDPKSVSAEKNSQTNPST